MKNFKVLISTFCAVFLGAAFFASSAFAAIASTTDGKVVNKIDPYGSVPMKITKAVDYVAINDYFVKNGLKNYTVVHVAAKWCSFCQKTNRVFKYCSFPLPIKLILIGILIRLN